MFTNIKTGTTGDTLFTVHFNSCIILLTCNHICIQYRAYRNASLTPYTTVICINQSCRNHNFPPQLLSQSLYHVTSASTIPISHKVSTIMISFFPNHNNSQILFISLNYSPLCDECVRKPLFCRKRAARIFSHSCNSFNYLNSITGCHSK